MPLAWLTARCDLPFRRVWTVLTLLPLVVPSYVGAFIVIVVLGPRGMVQGWLSPLGVERLPEIYGLPGAALCLTALSYPYVMLPVRAAFARLDPALEESARTRATAGRGPSFARRFRCCGPPSAGGAAGGTVRAERLRGRVTAALRDVHVGYLPPIRVVQP